MTQESGEWQGLDDRYRALFHQATDAIIMLDLEFRVLDCNPAAMVLLGNVDLEVVIGRCIYDFIRVEPELHPEALLHQLFLQGTLPPYERTVHTSDGRQQVVEVNLQVIRDQSGEPSYLQVIAHDLSPRQARQSKLMDTLFTGIAHDTRTPISSVKTSLYLIRRKLGDLNPVVTHLDVVEAQIDRLNTLIESAMEFARLGSGQVEFDRKPIQLEALVRQVVAGLDERFREKQQVISQQHEALPAIPVDAHYLTLALEHLLLNARQFTPTGGSIRVETYQDGNLVCIAVQDSGRGIAPQDRGHVFEPFYKADQARSGGGHGLGLPIVKEIIEAHHGTIEIHSVPDEGTVVALTLPLEQVTN